MLRLEPAEIFRSIINPLGGPGPFEANLVGTTETPGSVSVLGRQFEGEGKQFVRAILEFRPRGAANRMRLRLLPTKEIEFMHN